MGPIVVVKVGGSLLTLPDLGERLASLLRRLDGSRSLVIVGGGAVTDVVRDWDRRHGLGEERAHRLALGSLRLTSELLRTLRPELEPVAARGEADAAWNAGRPALLDVVAFLADAEPLAAIPLPHAWTATSDSIAAWIATVWPADELVLAKSVPCPVGGSPAEAARDGLVDPHFPVVAATLPCIRWANLRDDGLRIERWIG